MNGIFPILLGILAFAVALPAFHRGMPRLIFFTVMAGFCFWYWLPGLNLVTVGYVGLDNFFITPTVNDACWLVLLYALAALALLWFTQPLMAQRAAPVEWRIPARLLAQVVLASALAYLIVRFAAQGTAILTELMTGAYNARSEMDFSNHSQSAAQSLLALWEITTIWAALFCIAWHVTERQLLTLGGVAAMGALVMLFVGSGTRAVLLQALFVGMMARFLRPAAPRRPSSGSALRVLFYAVPTVLLAGSIYAGFKARFEDDAGYAAAGMMITVVSTFIVNNDMMRELAFAFDSFQPSLSGAWDYFLTPFTFMMPSFLGFEKNIPAHLITYNQLRAGIDVESGQGNVFPGLVADFWLVFGSWGPVVFAVFLALFAIGVVHLSRLVPSGPARLAYQIVAMSYLFFSFRNISGALVLVLVFGVGFLWSTWPFAGKMRPNRPRQGGKVRLSRPLQTPPT